MGRASGALARRGVRARRFHNNADQIRVCRSPGTCPDKPHSKSTVTYENTIPLLLITLLCAAIAGLQSVHAATITVMNTNDSGMGSLRQALAIANNPGTIPP